MIKHKILKLLRNFLICTLLTIGLFSFQVKANIHIQPFKLSQSSIVYHQDLNKPRILLYNTHNNEKVQNANIKTLTLDLKQRLEKEGLIVDIMEGDFVLNDYNNAYSRSNIALKQQLTNNTYNLIIDLHIDSLEGKVVKDFDNKTFAPLMFVFDTTVDNYNNQKELADTIKSNMVSKDIFRNDWEYDGSIFGKNQCEPNTLLIEGGFQTNDRVECQRSFTYLSKAIAKSLK